MYYDFRIIEVATKQTSPEPPAPFSSFSSFQSGHRLQQPQMLASVKDVQLASASGSAVLIDSRDARRCVGLEEPIDAKAGHIPGALNYFWKDVLGTDGRWSGVEALEGRFAKLGKDDAIIVYCGSSVSACPNVIALEEVGFSNLKLYSGSWSDWISYEGNAVATGEEN